VSETNKVAHGITISQALPFVLFGLSLGLALAVVGIYFSLDWPLSLDSSQLNILGQLVDRVVIVLCLSLIFFRMSIVRLNDKSIILKQ